MGEIGDMEGLDSMGGIRKQYYWISPMSLESLNNLKVNSSPTYW
jgi:hypothetical protein